MALVKKKVRVRSKKGKTYTRSMSVRSDTHEGSVRVRFLKQSAGNHSRATKVGAVLGGLAGAVGGAVLGGAAGGVTAHRTLSRSVREANPWLSVGGMSEHNRMIGNIIRNNPSRAASHYGGNAARGALVGGGMGGAVGAAAGAALGNLAGRALSRGRARFHVTHQ